MARARAASGRALPSRPPSVQAATAQKTVRIASSILSRTREKVEDLRLKDLLGRLTLPGNTVGVFQVANYNVANTNPPTYRLQSSNPLCLLLPSNVLLQEAKEMQLAELLHRCEIISVSLHSNSTLGNSCPKPGSIPNGAWSCQTQELIIPDATFLDSDANTYPGE